MNLKEAMALVLELASDNVIDARRDPDMQDEHDRQTAALALVHDHMESLA